MKTYKALEPIEALLLAKDVKIVHYKNLKGGVKH